MANTYGEAGVTYGQAGGTYGNWSGAAPPVVVAPGGKLTRPRFHHPPLPRIIPIPQPEPPAPIDARYGQVVFTCSAEFAAAGSARKAGTARFVSPAPIPRLAASGAGSLHNDDDELILLGVL